jgi:hypothetical protein
MDTASAMAIECDCLELLLFGHPGEMDTASAMAIECDCLELLRRIAA